MTKEEFVQSCLGNGEEGENNNNDNNNNENNENNSSNKIRNSLGAKRVYKLCKLYILYKTVQNYGYLWDYMFRFVSENVLK